MDAFINWRWWIIRKIFLISKKVIPDIEKKFDSKPVSNKNLLKTKIKSHGDKDSKFLRFTNFYDKEILKMNSNHTCVRIVSLDSDLQKDENYYLKVFLEGCKYIGGKVIKYINDNLNDFLILMSLMKNNLEWVRFFCKSVST